MDKEKPEQKPIKRPITGHRAVVEGTPQKKPEKTPKSK